MSIDIRDHVRIVMINKYLDEFMIELKRNYHNASLNNLEIKYDGDEKDYWQWLADLSADLIKGIQQTIDCEDIYHYGRSGATIATDCYWAMRSWEREDVAAEFDLPLSEQDSIDYNCLDFDEAVTAIKRHAYNLKFINNAVDHAKKSLTT